MGPFLHTRMLSSLHTPMPLLLQITEDLKTAMKAKDEAMLGTVRMLKSALKNKQIDLYGAEAKELSDEEIMAVIKTQIKQLKDAAETFKTGDRADMAASSLKEITVLEKYLPAQMDEAALITTVKGALAAAGMTSKADAGKAMGVAMKAVAGKADAGRVKAVVESVLVALVLGLVLHAAVPTTAFAADTSFNPVLYVVYGLRAARVFLLLGGIVALNTLVSSSFKYMVAGGREDDAHHAHSGMYGGILGIIVITGLFVGITVALKNVAGM